MNSTATRRFWKAYADLPAQVKKQAKEAFTLFRVDPYYPSLHFNRGHSTRPIFSVRINIDYRAVGIVEGEEILWYWIGSHTGYEKLIKTLRNP